MRMKANEGFREYAQRWRDTSAQVNPLVIDKEANYMFLETLKESYHNRLITSGPKDFSDIILSGELLEKAIKSSLLEGGESNTKKGQNSKKKEDKVHATDSHLYPYTY